MTIPQSERMIRFRTNIQDLVSSEHDYDRLHVIIQEHTPDFAHNVDPWSQITMEVLTLEAREYHLFANRKLFEAGIGDGRNVQAVYKTDPTIISVCGVDIVPEKIAMASRNLSILLDDEQIPYELVSLDIIDYLRQRENPLSGAGIACLPQSPPNEGNTAADGYKHSESLTNFIDESWNPEWHAYVEQYGLTLNAAALDLLHRKAEPGFNLVIVLSNRIPKDVRLDVIAQSGWEIVRKHGTHKNTPVQQDPDTYIGYVEGYDDGRRFYEKTEEFNGHGKLKIAYQPITAHEAESRRLAALETARQEEARTGVKIDARQFLNVYHHLSVYILKNKAN